MRRLDTFWSSDVINFAWVAAVSNSGKLVTVKNMSYCCQSLKMWKGKAGFLHLCSRTGKRQPDKS